MLGRNMPTRAASRLRILPAMNAGNIDARHFGNRRFASAFFDHTLGRVHGANTCDNRKQNASEIL